MDLPGAVPQSREVKALQDERMEKEDEDDEPIDPKAESLQALNSKLKALDMKSRMRDAFSEPSYIATEHYKKHGCAQRIARSYWFEHGTMSLWLQRRERDMGPGPSPDEHSRSCTVAGSSQ
eukprot:Skav233848  [mRNA]  locus=scaffold3130:157963:160620:- [translate_table: standard]